jgi:phosphoserine phosphatase
MEIVKSDIKTLYQERKKYIEESNYIKAEEISKKISNYKSFQMKKQQRELAQKKESEQNNFEKSYSEELFLFKQRWSKIEEEFQNDIKLKIKELKKRQKLELNEFIKNITEREIKQKITPNYINLKKVEEELVKQERFLEAEQIKHQAEKVLKKENNLMEIEYQQKIKKQIQLFKNRQNEEMTKFIEDNNKDIYKIQKKKNEEYDKIINKYRAFKVEMMLRQKDEETRAKKMLQKAFRAGKRSMSQEIKSNSNYFK